MSTARRLADAARAIARDPVARRGYLARLRWLTEGTGGIPAWSLEYRAGLTGRYRIDAPRLASTAELVMSCPPTCPAGAPLTHLYERRSVYQLRNTVVATSSAATVASGPAGPYFIRESITWPHESIVTHGLEVPDPAKARLTITEPCIAFPTTANYYHWLIEDLPAVLRAAACEPSAALIAFADGMTDRHRAVARALGRILRPVPDTIRASTHVLAGRADGNWFAHPEDIDLLRTFGAHVAQPSGFGERIYVSRRLSRRSYAAEPRVERALADAGFSILVLESMPWAEQIAAFRDARVVVAPHGAGLANLAFSDPGVTVLELIDGAMYNRCYEWLSHVAEHDYRMVPIDDIATGDDVLARLTP